eukprot:2888927-Prymnesium_polylepis.1
MRVGQRRARRVRAARVEPVLAVGLEPHERAAAVHAERRAVAPTHARPREPLAHVERDAAAVAQSAQTTSACRNVRL